MKGIVNTWLECVHCGKQYDLEQVRYNCECGGILDVKRDLSKIDGKKLKQLWESRWGMKRGPLSSGVWRYKELILDVAEEYIVTRQEGNTRLYPAGKAGEYAGIRNFLLKHEGENPTGSFKDRGMTCGATAAKIYAATSVACASTGNRSAVSAAMTAMTASSSMSVKPQPDLARGKAAASAL